MTPSRPQTGEFVWQPNLGDPEPGYNEWFAQQVKEALTDPGPAIPREEAVHLARTALRNIK